MQREPKLHLDNDLGSQRRPRNGKRELSAGAAAGGMKKYTVQGYIDVSVKKKSRIFSLQEDMRDFFCAAGQRTAGGWMTPWTKASIAIISAAVRS